MSAPPPYSPSAAASAPASAPAAAPSLFAVRVEYRGCAPKNAMVFLGDHGTCLEARLYDDEDEVVLIVSTHECDIARCCTQIADVLYGTILRCERITTDEQRRAALHPRADSDFESDSDSDFKSSSHSGPDLDRLTRLNTNNRTPTEWAIIAAIFIVPALLAYFMGPPAVSIYAAHPSL